MKTGQTENYPNISRFNRYRLHQWWKTNIIFGTLTEEDTTIDVNLNEAAIYVYTIEDAAVATVTLRVDPASYVTGEQPSKSTTVIFYDPQVDHSFDITLQSIGVDPTSYLDALGGTTSVTVDTGDGNSVGVAAFTSYLAAATDNQRCIATLETGDEVPTP